MPSLYYCLIVLCGLFVPFNTYADENQKEVIIAVSGSSKPYVFDNGKGLIIDVITEALAHSGHRSHFIRLNNQSAIEQFNQNKFDALAISNQSISKGYRSEPYITFNNMAISLAQKGYTINSLDDLANKRITAFSAAHKYLGPELSTAINTFDSYHETKSQKEQVELLVNNETDVVISDRLIFKYHLQQLLYESRYSGKYLHKITYYPIFSPNHYRAVFHDPALRDDFNKGLLHLQKSGRMEELEKYYQILINQYG